MSDNQYDNTNRGIMGLQDKKGNPNWADWNGHINVDGKEYWISGWAKRRHSDNSPLISLSIKPREARAASKPPPATGPNPNVYVPGDQPPTPTEPAGDDPAMQDPNAAENLPF